MRCLFTWSTVQYSTVQYGTIQYIQWQVRCLLTWSVRWSDLEKALLQMSHLNGLTPVCFLWGGSTSCHVKIHHIFKSQNQQKENLRILTIFEPHKDSGFSKQFCRFITEIFLKRWQWGALPCAWSARQTWRTSSRSLASCRRRASPRCESWCGPSGGWTWRSAGPDFTSFTFTAASIYSIKVYDYVTNVTYMQYICNVYCIR